MATRDGQLLDRTPRPYQYHQAKLNAFAVQKPLTPAETITRLVDDIKSEFGLEGEVPLRDATWSPSKSGGSAGDRLLSQVKFLYFQDRDKAEDQKALDRALADFREIAPNFPSSKDRLGQLLQCLQDPIWLAREGLSTTSSSKVNAWREQKVSSRSAEARSADKDGSPEEKCEDGPGSPTPCAKRIPEAMVDSVMLPPDLPIKPVAPSGTTNANASFTTTANTSFAATSFASEISVGPPSTAATSFDGALGGDRSPPSTYPFSSPSEGEFQRLERNEPEVKKARPAEGHAEELLVADSVCRKKRRTSEKIEPIQPSNPEQSDRQHPMQHQVAKFPDIGFGCNDSASAYHTPSAWDFGFRYERARLAQALKKPLDDLVHVKSPRDLRDLAAKQLPGKFTLHAVYGGPVELGKSHCQDDAVSYNISIAPSQSNKGPLIETRLHMPRSGDSNRVHRRFKSNHALSDRLLYANLAYLSDVVPQHLKGEQSNKDVREAYLAWLLTPKEFLGRTWRVFHLQPNKKKPNSTKDVTPSHRLVLFAVSGRGLPEVTLQQLLDWHIPFHCNQDQYLCKAFARLDLAISASTSTLKFKPSEIHHIDDCLADGTLEDSSFDNTHGAYPDGYSFALPHDPETVMNDGCARISVGAARKVCDALGIRGGTSAFQARINGAKGVWYVSAPYDTINPAHLETWIEITPSQRKIMYGEDDLDDRTCEEGRWSFDVVRYATPARAQSIHRDFMQILEAGGVSRDTLAAFAEKQVKDELDELVRALSSDDPIALRIWTHKHEHKNVEIAKREPFGLPSGPHARVALLLEAGFRRSSRFLAECTIAMAEQHMADLRKSLRFPCEQSTSLIGVEDPTGLLEPGQIHVCFSEPFLEEDQSRAYLDRMEVLATRHPTLRGSDIHKVKAIFLPELAYLKDVVVFPSKGRIPLAARLQGGDYDGDTFLLCWDRRLTEQYKNSPMLCLTPTIGEFGIEQRKEKIGSLFVGPVATAEQVDKWLGEVLAFKYDRDLLGIVTNHFQQLAYKQNNLWSPEVLAIAGLHDLLIDTAKNGYVFTRPMLDSYLQQHGYLLTSDLKEPEYSATTKSVTNKSHDIRNVIHRHRPNKHRHILDHMMFNIVDPLVKTTLQGLDASFESTSFRDKDLEYAYTSAMSAVSEHKDVITAEINHIKRLVERISMSWGRFVALGKESEANYAREYISGCIQPCWEDYESIAPCNPFHPRILGWMDKPSSHGLRFWDYFKASILAAECHKRPKFIFAIARTALCEMKANSTEDTRMLCFDMAAIMKVKKMKTTAEAEAAHYSANHIERAEDDGEVADWDQLDDAELLGLDVG